MIKPVIAIYIFLQFLNFENSYSQSDKMNADSSSLFANSSEKFVPDFQKMNLINRGDSTEAFPYLSADGLRLYFTSNRGLGDRLYFSSRKTIKDVFGTPGILSQNIEKGFMKGTLTSDELTLCMEYGNRIYIATRGNTNDEFSAPVLVRGLKEEYYTSPSISPDGNEIIVMINGYGPPVVLKKISDYTFTESNYNPLPGFWGNSQGQYSKDGLAFYIMNKAKYEKNEIWMYVRKTVAGKFTKEKEFQIKVAGIKNIMHPSLSSDGKIVICTSNNGEHGTWQEDNLLLIEYDLRFNKSSPLVCCTSVILLSFY